MADPKATCGLSGTGRTDGQHQPTKEDVISHPECQYTRQSVIGP